MQLVSAELFSRAHGLVQSSGTNNNPPSLSGNAAASSWKNNSVNKRRVQASPKAADSKKASSISKQKAAVGSPKSSSISKRKTEKLDQQAEVQTLGTDTTPPEKKMSRLERKLSSSKRKASNEGGKFGLSLSPSKRRRGGSAVSEQTNKASTASKKAQDSKAANEEVAASERKKGKQKEAFPKAAPRRGGRKGVQIEGEPTEKQKGSGGKRKRGSFKSDKKADTMPQKGRQSRKPESFKITEAAEQTPKTRYNPC